MTRADWMQVEREFNRRDGPHKAAPMESDMGLARWTRWGVEPNDCCTLELGFHYRFDIRPGPRIGPYAGDWRASSREQSLGAFPTFEAAVEACEAEARRLFKTAVAGVEPTTEMRLALDHWQQYLERPHRQRSRRQSSRRR